ncbi:MAG: glycosyltransferase [Myxococcales bacterium]|nr:glycosyltransferase [Myxococcales bacterium]
MTCAVSVLLPVRDAATTLEAALRSLLRQTFSDFEIVAVDDHSQDGSLEILRRWAQREGRLRVLENPGRGLVAALEHARAAARGALLSRMDADDVCHPRRFELQVSHLLRHPELAGTGCRVRLFPRGRLRQGWIRYESWQNEIVSCDDVRRERFVESPLVHPSVTLRAAAVARAGGYREREWPEDYDLFLRLLEAGERLDKVPRCLFFWRHSARRASVQDRRYDLERHREMKLHFLLAGPLSRTAEAAIWGAGPNGRRWARLLRDAGRRVHFFIDIDPHKIGKCLDGTPVRSAAAAQDAALPFVLGAVGSPGARPLIRQALRAVGRVEERDFLFVQ